MIKIEQKPHFMNSSDGWWSSVCMYVWYGTLYLQLKLNDRTRRMKMNSSVHNKSVLLWLKPHRNCTWYTGPTIPGDIPFFLFCSYASIIRIHTYSLIQWNILLCALVLCLSPFSGPIPNDTKNMIIIKEHRRNNNLITIICNLIHRCHRYRTRPQYRLSLSGQPQLTSLGSFRPQKKRTQQKCAWAGVERMRIWTRIHPPRRPYCVLLLMLSYICSHFCSDAFMLCSHCSSVYITAIVCCCFSPIAQRRLYTWLHDMLLFLLCGGLLHRCIL